VKNDGRLTKLALYMFSSILLYIRTDNELPANKT